MSKSYLISFCFFLSLYSCKEKDHDLTYLLNNKYANRHVNNSDQKSKIIQSLSHSNLNNIEDINLKLNQLGDGHVYLQKINEELYKFKSDLKYIPGTQFIESCLMSCTPSLNGKYKILEINGIKLDQFFTQNSTEIFASSLQGRFHRTFQLLQFSKRPINYTLRVSDVNGKVQEIKLKSLESIKENLACVEGKRLNSNHYYIKVNTLWCNLNGKITADVEIFKEFEKQWNQSISEINLSDNIILDIRENNGGGDNEVMLILNTFIDHQVVLYKYQYLKETIYSKKEWLQSLFQFKKSIWGNIGIDYTNLKLIPIKRFYQNNLKTLISPGCFSSCEGLAGNLKIHKRSKLYGSTTHGGAGDPKMYKIKNSNYLINLPSCLVWLADGTLIEGKGITPDFISKDTFLKNNDEVLLSLIKN